MTEMPLVSIIVPVFNTGKLIIDFVKSIKGQSYENWELILVDDGSDEKTIDVIKSLKASDSRIHFSKREKQPKGSLTCRNIGMQQSRGRYIIHFDADDLVESFCLEQRVRFMEQNPSLDYAVFKGASFCSDELSNIHVINHRWGRKRNSDDVVSFLCNDYPFSVWNCIYKSSVFKEIIWDENVKIYTDFSYILPILLKKYKYSYSTESRDDYLYRVNQKNAMTSSFISKEKFVSTIYLFRKVQDEILSSEKPSFYKKKFKRYYIVQIERIFNTMNNDYISEFAFFYKLFYGFEMRMCLLLFVNKLLKKGKINSRKLIRFFVALLYNQNFFIKWILSLKRYV